MEDKKFTIKLEELTEMMQVQLKPDEQQEYLNRHDNIQGLCLKLQVDALYGLQSLDKRDLAARVAQFGRNEIPLKPPKTFFYLMWDAWQDTTLIILTVCAVISLASSLFNNDSANLDHEFSKTGYNIESSITI